MNTTKQEASLEAENWHTGAYASLIPSAILYRRTYLGFLSLNSHLKIILVLPEFIISHC